MQRILLLFLAICLSFSVSSQVVRGTFCLEYYPQPLVETYVDSLASYLSKELADEDGYLDSTTLDYIDHFSSLAIKKSKCIFFNTDTLLIREQTGDELVNAYMILQSENKLLSRNISGLVEQNYFLEESEEMGRYEYIFEDDRSDTKLIEGFLCYRLELTEVFHEPNIEQPRERKFILYVTDEIKVPGGFILGNNMQRIIGCPLEIQEPLNSKVRIAYRAARFKLTIPEQIFKSL